MSHMSDSLGREQANPRVSVIVPAHNAEKYLGQCLESILGQTERNIEVIFVDDGSTDSTPEVLEKAAKADARVKVITQACAGAGAARNAGLAVACGEYLSFLDADDFFEPKMLEDAADKLDQTGADIAAYGSWLFDEGRQSNRQAKWLLKTQNLSEGDVHTHEELAPCIFNTFGNEAWSKLLRASFVREHGLRFQEITRANDLLFTCTALAMAKSIAVIDKCYVHYRVGTGINLQATNDKDPLSFLEAFFALDDFLKANNLEEELRQSFSNHILDAIAYNSDSFKSIGTLGVLATALRDRIEPRFELLAFEGDDRIDQSNLQRYRDLMELDVADYLFKRTKGLMDARDDAYWYSDWAEWRIWQVSCEAEERMGEMRARIEELERQRNDLQYELDEARSTFGYRAWEKVNKIRRR